MVAVAVLLPTGKNNFVELIQFIEMWREICFECMLKRLWPAAFILIILNFKITKERAKQMKCVSSKFCWRTSIDIQLSIHTSFYTFRAFFLSASIKTEYVSEKFRLVDWNQSLPFGSNYLTSTDIMDKETQLMVSNLQLFERI